MKIVIYIESLRTFTSGTPHRGVLFKLIELRSNDEFVLVLRKGGLPEHMQELFNKLKKFSNWSLRYEKISRKLVNMLALLNFKNHCEIKAEGDVYLSFDAEYLGFKNHPQIVTLHDLSSVRNSKSSSISPLKRIARKFTIENGIKHADHIVAISEFTKNDLLDYFDMAQKEITVIHNGIDKKWFHESISNTTSYNDNYWIWWGAYSQRKNLERLLQAYELLLKETDNIPDLYLVGNQNEYFVKLLLIIEGSKVLKRKVKIYPQQDIDNLKVLVSNSVGLVFPSLYEGFGLPVIEAYSQGVPVLTSNMSSLPEISGGLGVLVDPNDTIDIKNGLLKFNMVQHNHDEKLKQWAEQFTYKNSALKYAELIDRCLKK